ncbi:MAG: Fe-S oxidoreductase [Haloplasmataceae bacterium]|nr:Fe-S oxidoreductase [Haloplasmataceae bacterium]
MKTLLVAINAKYIHTNLAVRYLYTYCNKQFVIDFVEFSIKDQLENIIDSIINSNAKIIAFSCYIWNIEYIKDIITNLKLRDSELIIILGGPEVSYEPKYFLESFPVNYIISGEGEYPFYLLLSYLHKQVEITEVPQLHYREGNFIVTNQDEYVMDLDDLPSPYRLERDNEHLSHRIQYVESSRGCPFQCSYCLASLEKNVRFFDIEKVKDEIRYLMNHGAKVFKFLDRTFNIRKTYAIDMFNFIIKEHHENCVFQFEITSDLLDEEVIHYLNQNAPKGLIRFEIGVQSTNENTNKLILRKQNFQKLSRNVLLIQAGNKIDLHLDLIAGLPKEDYLSFINTFNEVITLRPQELQLGFLKMLRGTKIRIEAEIYNYTFQEHAPYEMIKNDVISEDDIKNIHIAEDMLEKYYNSHRFDQTIKYILDHIYQTNNYQFFEELGLNWYEQYSPIKYQYHDLCTRLLDFMKTKNTINQLTSLVIYDYLKTQKTKPKIWFETNMDKNERNQVFKYLTENKQEFNYDLLYRYAFVHKLTIHPKTYQEGHYYLVKLFSPHNNNIYIIDL